MRAPSTLKLAISLFCLALLPAELHAFTAAQVFDKAKNSVVVVKTLDHAGKEKSQGSGVLLPSGKIATNRHVVKGGIAYRVGWGEQFFPATLYAEDCDKDICLLDAKVMGKKPAEIGKTASLKIGDRVYAVGAPQGLELSLSDGLVAQLRGGPPPLIQTTAAISPGSSGGGLFDSEGRLVGLTTLYIEGGQNLNFAIPVEWIGEVKPGQKATVHPTVRKGFLYVEADPADARIRIMNIVPRFFQGIELMPGSYHVEVSAPGYETKNVWTKLKPGEHKRIKIRLERAEKTDLGFYLEVLLKAVRIKPEDEDAWYYLGVVYGELKRHNEAIEAYRQALRIEPENANAWYNLGIEYGELGRYNDAIEAFRQAVRIKPEDAKVWYNLGIEYGELGRYNDAIEAYRQAIRIKPEYAKAWVNLGADYGELGRHNDAIEAYRQALRIEPENANAWHNLGVNYGLLNRLNDAIEAFRQAIRIKPEYAKAWYCLGLVHYQSGNTGAAMDALKVLRRLDPATADELFDVIVPR